MNSGFERYPLWVMMGVDVAVEVEKQRYGAYISVCVFMVTVSAAPCAMCSALFVDTARLHPCDGPFNSNCFFPDNTAMLRPPQFDPHALWPHFLFTDLPHPLQYDHLDRLQPIDRFRVLGYCIPRYPLPCEMDKLDSVVPHTQACSTLHT